jgi:probable HAF family extracellular repeat protein
MVVGEAMMSPGNMLPIMSTNPMSGSPSMMTMRMSGMGASGGGSWSLNNMGDTAGQADMPAGNHHATVSGNGGMMGQRTIDLGALGGTNSIAYYINDAGAVVGTAQLAGGMMHAFMVTNALGGMVRMIDLNDLIPTNSGWQLVEARGMNAAGQIVGWGMFAGHTNGFLLTPVSAPVMMTSSPSTQIVGPGTMVTLGMQMSASERLTYQWLQNGVPIAGATNATFTLPSGMSMENAGQYTVTARNGVGTVASSSAVVSMFSMQLTNGSPHLSVAAPSGSHFRIDYSDMLVNSANWQAMTNFTVTGSITQVIDTPPARRDSRYYRAVMTP